MAVTVAAQPVVEEFLMISEVARLLGVSIWVVRELTEQGRLPAAARTSAGYKLYRRADAERLAEERRLNPPKGGRPRKNPQAEPKLEPTKP